MWGNPRSGRQEPGGPAAGDCSAGALAGGRDRLGVPLLLGSSSALVLQPPGVGGPGWADGGVPPPSARTPVSFNASGGRGAALGVSNATTGGKTGVSGGRGGGRLQLRRTGGHRYPFR